MTRIIRHILIYYLDMKLIQSKKEYILYIESVNLITYQSLRGYEIFSTIGEPSYSACASARRHYRNLHFGLNWLAEKDRRLSLSK